VQTILGNLFHAIKLISSKVVPVILISGNVRLPEKELRLNLHEDLHSFRAGFDELQLNSERRENQGPYADFPVARHIAGSMANLHNTLTFSQGQQSPIR